MKRLLIAVVSFVAVVSAVWGVSRTVPRVGDGGPGFLAKEISGVLGWTLVGALGVGYLWLFLRRRS